MPVYFIRAGEHGPVKVGSADDVAARLLILQCGNPETLSILRTIEGGRAEEHWLHRHFKQLWLRGEWFTFDPAMLDVEVPAIDVLKITDGPWPVVELAQFLAEKGIAPEAFATVFNPPVTPDGVRKWLRGERIPRKAAILRILELTGGNVRPEAFYEARQKMEAA